MKLLSVNQLNKFLLIKNLLTGFEFAEVKKMFKNKTNPIKQAFPAKRKLLRTFLANCEMEEHQLLLFEVELF